MGASSIEGKIVLPYFEVKTRHFRPGTSQIPLIVKKLAFFMLED
jgi:hypothetical protein